MDPSKKRKIDEISGNDGNDGSNSNSNANNQQPPNAAVAAQPAAFNMQPAGTGNITTQSNANADANTANPSTTQTAAAANTTQAGPSQAAANDNGQPPKKKRQARNPNRDYSAEVRKMYETSTRNPWACDRCKIRKMKCNRDVEKCGPCEKSGKVCNVTDPFTFEPAPRGALAHAQKEIARLQAEIAKFQDEMATLRDENRTLQNQNYAYAILQDRSNRNLPPTVSQAPVVPQPALNHDQITQSNAGMNNADAILSNNALSNISSLAGPPYFGLPSIQSDNDQLPGSSDATAMTGQGGYDDGNTGPGDDQGYDQIDISLTNPLSYYSSSSQNTQTQPHQPTQTNWNSTLFPTTQLQPSQNIAQDQNTQTQNSQPFDPSQPVYAPQHPQPQSPQASQDPSPLKNPRSLFSNDNPPPPQAPPNP